MIFILIYLVSDFSGKKKVKINPVTSFSIRNFTSNTKNKIFATKGNKLRLRHGLFSDEYRRYCQSTSLIKNNWFN